jgi:hypothetical protein
LKFGAPGVDNSSARVGQYGVAYTPRAAKIAAFLGRQEIYAQDEGNIIEYSGITSRKEG